MSVLTAEATCPTCGGPLNAVNVGKPTAGTHTTTICRCAGECGHRWQATLTLRPIHGRRERGTP